MTKRTPSWKSNAEKTALIGEIESESGDYEVSAVDPERAREIIFELRQLGDGYVRHGPAVLGWVLQWMADDLDAVMVKLPPKPENPADRLYQKPIPSEMRSQAPVDFEAALAPVVARPACPTCGDEGLPGGCGTCGKDEIPF